MDRVAMDRLAVETPDILTDTAAGENPAKRRPAKWIVVALLVLAVVGALLQARRRTAAANAAAIEPPQLTNVQVSKTYRGSIGYYVEALGTVTPLATVNVYSQVNGTVTAVHYVEGQMVHRGDPLLDIDPRPYEAQLKEALATLQHDQASLRQAQQDLRPNLFGILAGHSSHNRGLHRVAADPGV